MSMNGGLFLNYTGRPVNTQIKQFCLSMYPQKQTIQKMLPL